MDETARDYFWGRGGIGGADAMFFLSQNFIVSYISLPHCP